MTDTTLNFCTLFDSGYLTRGLALYKSLEKYCPKFTLYILAFDTECFDILKKLNLPNAIVISLPEFEDPELLKIKSTRTRQEYCWTCSSSIILYTLKKYNLDMCTYIDSDILFFDNPQILLDEMKDNSVLLTEHRLPEGSKKIERLGMYCVQFMPFRNNPDGLKVLTWWRERCLEWCYARIEDGKFGDQKYLDDWTTRFSGVYVLKHIGGGVAPWNIYRYHIAEKEGKFFITEDKTGKKDSLVFYHFQSTKIFDILESIVAVYWPYDSNLTRRTSSMYREYADYVRSSLQIIQSIKPGFHLGFAKTSDYFQFILRKIIKETERSIKGVIKSLLQ